MKLQHQTLFLAVVLSMAGSVVAQVDIEPGGTHEFFKSTYTSFLPSNVTVDYSGDGSSYFSREGFISLSSILIESEYYSGATFTFKCAENTPNGTYNGMFTIVFSKGSQSKTIQEGVVFVVGGGVAPPVADFMADTTHGEAPLTVQFTNLSTGTITSYYWDFGYYSASNDSSPFQTYNLAGYYTVSLTVTGPGGSDTETKTNYIHIVKGKLKWVYYPHYQVQGSPAIGYDGTIYQSFAGSLQAITPTGRKRWSCEIDGLYNSPAIGQDGSIYIGSLNDKKLYAISSSGTIKWTFLTGNYLSDVAVGQDGTVYIGSGESNKFYALKPDGTLKWSYSSHVTSSPSIDQDGIIYFGSGSGLTALYPDGKRKWEFITGDYTQNSSPAIGQDGTIYVGADDRKLYAINPNGKKKWNFSTLGYIQSSPVIGSDGTIYVGSVDNYLYALNPDGTKKWAFDTGRLIWSSPTVGDDGTIYVGSKQFYALNQDGTLKWELDIENWRSSPAICQDGAIIIAGGLDESFLFSITSPSYGLAESPWPKLHQNNQNTGCLADTMAPQAISDLTIVRATDNTITLKWTATGDDSVSRNANQYDLRYQTLPPGTDTTGWWASAVQITNEPTPSDPGVQDSVIVSPLSPNTQYYFLLKVIDDGGNESAFSNVAEGSTLLTGIESQEIAPKRFHLSQNYPNPFNPITSIHYELPKTEHVTLTVSDLLGEEVATLVDQNQNAGDYTVQWDASDKASGVYVVNIQAGSFRKTLKMVLMR